MNDESPKPHSSGPDVRAALQSALHSHQRGDVANAEFAYRRILERDPTNPDALHLLGLALHQLGRHEDAVHLIRRALMGAPTSAYIHCNLGVVLLALGHIEQAAESLRRALRLKSDYPEAHNNLGTCLLRNGKLDEASQACERALKIRPDYAQAHYNLGLIRHKQRRTSEAIASYLRALAIDPRHAEAHNDLGNAFQEAGRRDEAIAHYEASLKINPSNAAAHSNLGTALQDQGRFDEAVGHYEQALRLAPAMADAHFNLAWTYLERCDVEEAIAHFQKAQQLAPNDRNRIAIATAIAPVVKSRDDLLGTRERIARSLAALHDSELSLIDPLKQGLTPAPLLAYHGLDNRALQEALASNYLKACPSLAWTAPHCQTRKPIAGNRKIRVGFVSRYFYNHTVGEVTRGLIEHLDRTRFEVTIFRIGGEDDHVSRHIDAAADHLLRLPTSLPGAREAIAGQKLDVLVYPEIGMDPGTYFLAFGRLAPLQCVMWGHPDTTGIPTIDYYVSADVVEPAGAQAYYTERLITLKHIPTYYYRPALAAELEARTALGLPENRHLYVCPQTPYKFHPDFDGVLGAILRRDPDGALVLFHGRRPAWSEILSTRFRDAFPDAAERVVFLPRMALPRYFMVMRHACAMLDTLHFGGGNTVYQAFSQAVPVVTMPGSFARGRVTQALYRQMGITDLIAERLDDYVELALKLGTDAVFRDSMAAAIRSRSDVLFENIDVVREFERFIEAHAVAAS